MNRQQMGRRWSALLGGLRARATGNPPDQTEAYVSSGLLVESLLLTQLGTDLGSLGTGMETQLMVGTFSPFLNYLAAPARVDAALHTEDDIRISKQADELLVLFPRFSGMLQDAMRGEAMTRIEFKNPEPIRPHFNTLLYVHFDLAEDAAMNTFVRLLRYATSEQWEQLFQVEPTPTEVGLAAGEDTVGATTALYYGFLKQWRMWQEIADSLDAVARVAAEPDYLKFADRVRALFEWRFDTSSGILFNRFLELQKRVEDRAAAEVPDSQRSAFRKTFLESFEAAFNLQTA
jgi:hypothetical protein